MRKSTRIISIGLSLLHASGVMSSCRKTFKRETSIPVGKDDPWYDSVRFKLSLEKSETDTLMIYSSPEYINGKIYSTYSTCDIMKKEISLIAEYYNEVYDHEMEYGLFSKSQLKTMGFKKATDTMQQKFYNMLSTLSVYYMDDREIRNIVNEELAAFYAGDKTIDDVIRFINDRVDKYVSEVK
ncbi:MAG: hypothetical protein IKG93_01325 [Clostridiales bacterium]|nr:hypothetical protein [Clostridiales bacterium]